MLQELFVKNFAIIDSLNLSFKNCFNVLSGETGAGKSIIVGALGLLMGGRASADLIRTDENEAIVGAVFDVSRNKEIIGILSSLGFEPSNGELVIRRIISRTGKNRIFIADNPATMQVLSRIGGLLIDISGQYSQQLLLQVEGHIDILDAFGGLEGLRSQYQQIYKRFREIRNELNVILDTHKQQLQRKEIISFQHEEITRASLSETEEEDLLKERNILSNSRTLYENTFGVYASVYDDDNASLTQLKKSLRELENAAAIDPDLGEIKKRFESVLISLEDTVLYLRDYAGGINTDTGRIEDVESRLDEIRQLKKKYGPAISDVLGYKDRIADELQQIKTSSARSNQLREESSLCLEDLWKQAENLSEQRRKAAKGLQSLIEKELSSIGMEKSHFIVRVKSVPSARQHSEDVLNSYGNDCVEFFISPNQGEEPKPLAKIASGGEISRIVLAIKKILAENYRVPTLLFDEVDSGIGGAVAESVAIKLKEIAVTHQVLCITHLPQIAAYADFHYRVSKQVDNGRTVTCVTMLDDQGRLEELSRMLGGRNISAKTMEHAKEMLKSAGTD